MEPRKKRFKMEIGMQFGRLSVVERLGYRAGNQVNWMCQCECGQTVSVSTSNLRSGRQVSCGCYLRDVRASLNKGPARRRLRKIWRGMVRRCEDPKCDGFRYYGGRGINVCPRWKKFDNFYKDMIPTYEPGLTLDRIDNDGDYSPDNCRWATVSEQARNKRTNRFVVVDGEELPLVDAAKKAGLKMNTLRMRLNSGMDAEEAVSLPANYRLIYKDDSVPVGISWHQGSRRWRVRITVSGRSVWVGQFRSLEEAKEALAKAKGAAS